MGCFPDPYAGQARQTNRIAKQSHVDSVLYFGSERAVALFAAALKIEEI
jgi:hypothetical protein